MINIVFVSIYIKLDLVNWQLLKEVRDLALLRSFQEDTLNHEPSRDEDEDLALTVNCHYRLL